MAHRHRQMFFARRGDRLVRPCCAGNGPGNGAGVDVKDLTANKRRECRTLCIVLGCGVKARTGLVNCGSSRKIVGHQGSRREIDALSWRGEPGREPAVPASRQA